ncbi:MAG: phospho-N-acetylmuramoyl-pentapeptide-transferase [Synergistaceae bacterium]|jgi:phospho-N-acetylmuramoyl-pentapeptide-transferase|nr:phospho-N-acetylmuramoyl-pentapeptide-transferase [Synergistaceae bacterium]
MNDMKIKILCLGLIFFASAIFLESLWISLMRNFGVGEAIKNYGPSGHKKKKGTPGIGGIVAFTLSPAAALAIYHTGLGDTRDVFIIWVFPLLAGLVGFADDLLKAFRSSSEGLRSLQKLFLQILVCSAWVYFVSRDGIFLVPGVALPVKLAAPALVFLAVAALNAVNVTDGLDGLAGSAVAVSLLSVFLWTDKTPVLASAALGLAMTAAFLWHNSNPALVFMGDAGSHLWGALLVSLCVDAGSLAFMLPMGFIFAIELATSAIQIFTIRAFGKRIFRMSPLHHHFEIEGMKEPQIVARFTLVHAAGIAAILIFMETLLKGGFLNA